MTLAELLYIYENDFFRADFCRDAAALAERIADDFLEYSQSGQVFTKKDILPALRRLTEDRPIVIQQFNVQEIAADLAIVHYLSEQKGQLTLRTSIWREANGVWQLYFHQGTPKKSQTN